VRYLLADHHAPEVAILGVARARCSRVGRQASSAPAAAADPLSYDHRVIDGASARAQHDPDEVSRIPSHDDLRRHDHERERSTIRHRRLQDVGACELLVSRRQRQRSNLISVESDKASMEIPIGFPGVIK